MGTNKCIFFLSISDSKPFKCKYCEYACRDSSTLRKHEERHRGKVPVFKCKVCDKQYTRKSVLKVHVTEEHFNMDTKNKPCEICGKMFRDNTSRNVHVRVVHKQSYAVQCDVCGIYLSNKYNLMQHLRTHVDYRPYKCDFGDCKKAFKDKSTLKKHVILHYPSKHYECHICGRRFSRLSRFNRHSRQHEVKVKSVVCDYCGVGFYNKKYLTNHITKKHLFKQKYICDLCNFFTYNKPSIVMHIKHGHDSETDRECKICHKTYKRHIYLKSHYWNTHCIKYKLTRRRVLKKKVEVKEENEANDKEVPKIKEEVESGSDVEISKIQDSSDHIEVQVERKMDDFYVKEVVMRTQASKKPDPTIDAAVERNLQKELKRILTKSRREKEIKELERVRRMYNKRMQKLITKVPKPLAVPKPTNEIKIDNIYEKDETGKLKFNVHQCYVCFKLYETKEALLDHCQEHFDLCNSTILRKCPLCDYVCKTNMRRHLLEKHKINTKLHTGHIKDRKNNNNGSRFYFDIKNKIIDTMDVIPSVKHLNKQAYVNLDRKNREIKDKMVTKTKLVKKGKEWIVEKETINIDKYLIPKISDVKSVLKTGSDDYCGRMKRLSDVTKKNGGKMMFPCDKCEKICQTLSALKLHYRRHDPNKKPFKPKMWKHKLKLIENKKSKNTVTNTVTNTGIYTATDTGIATSVNPNRYLDPKPIVNKHKCDPELKKFYETNIKGGDIEFWQFLKIYNKMTRENIEDFSDLEKRTDFGFHIDNRLNKTAKDIKKVRKRIRGNVKVRKILISRKEYLKRNEIKTQMRQRIESSVQ
ncbi:unnamed protein product [Colias eurytheme]|nr:unnamed protein product [Colias eurytheme]